MENNFFLFSKKQSVYTDLYKLKHVAIAFQN